MSCCPECATILSCRCDATELKFRCAWPRPSDRAVHKVCRIKLLTSRTVRVVFLLCVWFVCQSREQECIFGLNICTNESAIEYCSETMCICTCIQTMCIYTCNVCMYMHIILHADVSDDAVSVNAWGIWMQVQSLQKCWLMYRSHCGSHNSKACILCLFEIFRMLLFGTRNVVSLWEWSM